MVRLLSWGQGARFTLLPPGNISAEERVLQNANRGNPLLSFGHVAELDRPSEELPR